MYESGCVRSSEAESAIPGSSKHEPLDPAQRDSARVIRWSWPVLRRGSVKARAVAST